MRARELRTLATKAERVLWQQLRRKQLGGFRFLRQRVIGPFIVDFVCPSNKLVIEVDGEVHDHQVERDTEREAYLEGQGYTILRFRNDAVMNHTRKVLEEILATLRSV